MNSQVAGLVLALCTLFRAAAGSEPVVIATGDASQAPRQPQVAVESSGAVHLVFGQGNAVLYCRSDNRGATFSAPVQLPGEYVVALGKRRGPRIAAADGTISISFIGGREGRGRDGDVLAFRSNDGGRNWTGPTRVNDAEASAREGLHAMAAGPHGELCCAWLDLRSGKTEIYASTSRDGGGSWDKNVLVYRSPDGSVCECCHPSAAYDAAGKLHVMWRNSLAGNRDMYFASSGDGGKSFGKSLKLGAGSWLLDACPMDGGSFAAAPDGTIYTAWRRDRDVFLARPHEAERRLGGGSQPWIAATTKGPYVVWLEDRTSRLLLERPDAAGPIALEPQAGDPVIAAPPDGPGPVAIAWERRTGNTTAVICQVLLD